MRDTVDRQVRIMTWNLHRLRVGDPADDLRAERIRAFLSDVAIRPDVLGVQELVLEQDVRTPGWSAVGAFAEFARSLGFAPEHCVVGAARGAPSRTALFSRFPLAPAADDWRAGCRLQMALPDATRFPWEPDVITFSRPPVFASLALPGDRRLNVLCAHLKSSRALDGTAMSEEGVERDCQATSALDLARGMLISLRMRALESLGLRALVSDLLRERYQDPFVLLADLNDVPDAVTTQMICGDVGPGTATHEGARQDALFHISGLLPPDQRWTYERRGARLHLDHILVNGMLANHVAEDCNGSESGPVVPTVRICHGARDVVNGVALSDHAPVWAVVEVPP